MEHVTIISAKKNLFKIPWDELWLFRELFQTLAWKDVKVKYKQTAIGVLWAIIQPLLQMIVFSFFFGKLAKIPSDHVPYPLFSYSGLVLWNMFSSILSSTSTSMVSNSHLVTKVYFPRIILPIATSIVFYIDYLISWIVLGLLFTIFNYPPVWTAIFSPFVGILVLMLANGIGFFLTSLNVQFRDIQYALPFFIQILVFVSPVIYPVSVAGRFEWIVNANPMSGYLELHRALILGHQSIDVPAMLYSILATIVIFMSGLYYFNWQQRKFADII